MTPLGVTFHSRLLLAFFRKKFMINRYFSPAVLSEQQKKRDADRKERMAQLRARKLAMSKTEPE